MDFSINRTNFTFTSTTLRECLLVDLAIANMSVEILEGDELFVLALTTAVPDDSVTIANLSMVYVVIDDLSGIILLHIL